MWMDPIKDDVSDSAEMRKRVKSAKARLFPAARQKRPSRQSVEVVAEPPAPEPVALPEFLVSADPLRYTVDFGDVDPRASKPHVILEKVAQHFGRTISEIKGRGRKRVDSEPRHVAIWLCAGFTSLSSVRIGQLFGRDHSTVLHAVTSIEKAINEGSALGQKANQIRMSLQGKGGFNWQARGDATQIKRGIRPGPLGKSPFEYRTAFVIRLES